ncbi:MAG TPA: diacylglycerol kinase family protein [Candidatus Saccharimonadales bacterium]|nr:diacylglycerol kinase family protein [Candidatus Saccharimonadales bacterium]
MLKETTRVKSFKYAFSGLTHAFTTQKNFQVQLVFAVAVVVLAYVLNFSRGEWMILVLMVGLVLTAELLNTVVEIVVDLAVKEKLLPEAKIAKDVSAAAVLLISIVSVVVGLLLFLPHFTSLR